jgi:hypothetical protein
VSGRSWDRYRDGEPPKRNAAILVCWRLRRGRGQELDTAETETTGWPSVAEAFAASEELAPCDPAGNCVRDHAVIFTDEYGRTRVRRPPKPKRRKDNR